MKLKKKIAALMLAATAVVASVCMTACGNDDAGDNNDTGDSKSEIIADEAAWKAAFDFSEVTSVTFAMTQTENGESGEETNKIVYRFDDDKLYEKVFCSQKDYNNYEGYYRYYDEVCVQDPDWDTEYTEYLFDFYFLGEDGYRGFTADKIGERIFVDDITEEITGSFYNEKTGEYVDGLAERFEDFKYNDETCRYEATFAEFGESTNLSVWFVFKGGKIYEGMFSGESVPEFGIFSGECVSYELRFTVTDIGTTHVTLPIVGEDYVISTGISTDGGISTGGGIGNN